MLFYFRRTGDEAALIINKSQVTNLCDDYMKYKTVFILSLSESFPPFTPSSSDGLPWHGHLNHGQIRPGSGPPIKIVPKECQSLQEKIEVYRFRAIGGTFLGAFGVLFLLLHSLTRADLG